MFSSRSAAGLLACVLAITFVATPIEAQSATRKPTLEEIKAAKEKEIAKASEAAKAKAKLATAANQLRALTVKANAARAIYLREQAALVVAIKKAEKAAKKESAAIAAVADANMRIGKMAANAYIMGSGFTDFDSILNANGPQDLADRLSILDSLGQGNSTVLARLKIAQAAAAEAKAEADAARAEQAVATARVAAAKKVADSARAEQQVEVNKLEKIQAQIIRELSSARKKRVTLEQQRQLAILEEELANRAGQTTGQAKIWPVTGVGFSNGRSTFRTSESQRSEAVAFAKKQVLARKPYVWGNEGPNSFDCSGLVFASYRSAGLDYTQWDRVNSRIYYSWTKRVPLSELLPGDLIFYSYQADISTIHHITIYAGNGMMWEAHSTAKGLLFSSIYSIPGLIPFGGRV
ncbi:MAG: C40 family peptidase [Actinobacteria bacterium]|nr:C40 family peptidase [Actinomycetota bacterium]